MNLQSDSAFTDAPAKPATKFYLSVLRAAAFLGIAATIGAFWAETNWVADLLSQLRIQWMVGLFGLMVLFALARRWWWMLICFIGLSVNAVPVWPYMASYVANFDPSKEADSSNAVAANSRVPLRLMSLNLLTKNRQWDDVIQSIKDAAPDFLVLMEVDSVWQQVCEQGLGETYPYAVFEAREDNFGIAFFSKHPWDEIKVLNSETLKLPSIDVTISNLGQKPLRIIATHPIPPMDEFNWNARNEQLLSVAQRFDDSTCNVMVGDFNLAPWSPNFKRVAVAGNLTAAGQAFGPVPTWYVFPTWIGGLKIDHALVSDDLSVQGLQVGQDVGSDHRAVLLDFDF